MKELLINLLNFLGLAFWVKIITTDPDCTYYFGPFLTAQDAHFAKVGYVEDIESEGANTYTVFVKRDKPSRLTVAEDLETPIIAQGVIPAFSPQP
ncbi:hypothetical protein M595_3798 [Lyngbya aestuarii BL J]|uniref:DUF1816 domain-containing protein n=1 Tax=Lyngbya aestuarii BL J TaxID=1348334 RepID=U7QEA3_9CYAN|nr:DUF1816 domain-containing protein [Lyngbya aestuarii]ERT06244.1 hypothetical protein M595_3798 [Lyngbya aestuarii BL J]